EGRGGEVVERTHEIFLIECRRVVERRAETSGRPARPVAEGVPTSAGERAIHDLVHVEVLKLYPEAMLPDFEARLSEDGNTLYFEYHSHRHFADLARGLMDGTFEHWNENVSVEIEDKSTSDKQIVLFTCTRQ
ncbi:MAG: heme NO-binding domain-containing protein, partial [Candidatus Poseidoniaceae archaeon]